MAKSRNDVDKNDKPPKAPVSKVVGLGMMMAGLPAAIGTHRYLIETLPVPAIDLADPVARLAYCLRFACLPAMATAVIIETVALARASDMEGLASDPVFSAPREPYWFRKLRQAQLNTTEQLLMFLITILCLSQFLDATAFADVRLCASLSITWAIGRLIFFLSYAIHPGLRGFGLLYSNFWIQPCLIGYCCYRLYLDMV